MSTKRSAGFTNSLEYAVTYICFVFQKPLQLVSSVVFYRFDLDLILHLYIYVVFAFQKPLRVVFWSFSIILPFLWPGSLHFYIFCICIALSFYFPLFLLVSGVYDFYLSVLLILNSSLESFRGYQFVWYLYTLTKMAIMAFSSLLHENNKVIKSDPSGNRTQAYHNLWFLGPTCSLLSHWGNCL